MLNNNKVANFHLIDFTSDYIKLIKNKDQKIFLENGKHNWERKMVPN